jgi:hypothetical protein
LAAYYFEQEGFELVLEEWMLEMLNGSEEDEQQLWDNTLMDGLEDEKIDNSYLPFGTKRTHLDDQCWQEKEKEDDQPCCNWTRNDEEDKVLYEEQYENDIQGSKFFIKGNPCPVHHCPGCGKRLDDE